jgi:hypothetical protein
LSSLCRVTGTAQNVTKKSKEKKGVKGSNVNITNAGIKILYFKEIEAETSDKYVRPSVFRKAPRRYY